MGAAQLLTWPQPSKGLGSRPHRPGRGGHRPGRGGQGRAGAGTHTARVTPCGPESLPSTCSIPEEAL